MTSFGYFLHEYGMQVKGHTAHETLNPLDMGLTRKLNTCSTQNIMMHVFERAVLRLVTSRVYYSTTQ